MPKRVTKRNHLESLWINFRPNKLAEPRVHIHSDTEDFTISENNPVDWDKFTPEQKFEIQWVLEGAAYNQATFGVNSVSQAYVRLLVDPKFYIKLREIKQKAEVKGIEFAPMKIMLEALKKEADKFEKKLK